MIYTQTSRSAKQVGIFFILSKELQETAAISHFLEYPAHLLKILIFLNVFPIVPLVFSWYTKFMLYNCNTVLEK